MAPTKDQPVLYTETTPVVVVAGAPVKHPTSFWYALTSPFRPLTYQLFLFHLLNVKLAVVAFAVVVSVGCAGIATIPLCCLGLVVLQAMLYAVHFFARVDAHFYNCIAPKDEQVIVQFQVPRRGLYQISGYRIAPDLSEFSKHALSAVFYFVFVKVPLAAAFSSSVLAMLAFSVTLIFFPSEFGRSTYTQLHTSQITTDGLTPITSTLSGVVLLYVAIALAHLFGKVQRATTKYFTCEFFATSGFVADGGSLILPQYAAVPLVPVSSYATTSAPLYGAVVVRRSAFERFASKFAAALLLAVVTSVSLVFSVGMFVLVVVGMSLTLGLLPAACLGLLVLQLVALLVGPLSKVDAWLHEQRQRLYAQLQRQD